MSNKKVIPSLAEFKAAGYKVNIKHWRLHKVAFIDYNSGKMVIKNRLLEKVYTLPPFGMGERLPKGGLTEITVTDPETETPFYASAQCRSDENYNKRIGVQKCLERIYYLMLNFESKNGFKLRFPSKES